MIKQIIKPIILKYENREINLPKAIKENIKLFWDKLTKENPNLFNGENHCVESIIEKEDRLEMNVVKTNYATHLYNERIWKIHYKILKYFSMKIRGVCGSVRIRKFTALENLVT